MPDENKISQLKNTLETAQTTMVVLSANPTVDELVAASSLYLSLLQSGKQSRIVAPRIPAILSKIDQSVKVDAVQIQTELGNENLTISFKYSEDQVDKVSYHIGEETGKFHLTIKPKPGFPPLDVDTVEFGYTGASADLIFLVNVPALESLEQLYFGYEDLYKNTPMVSMSLAGTSLGAIQLNPEYHSSLSELATVTLLQLGMTIDSDSATSLLYGIERFSQNLTAANTEPETFEVVAKLLRAGARRILAQQAPASVVKKESLMSFGEALRNASEAKEIPLEMADEQAGLVVPEIRQQSQGDTVNRPSKRRRRYHPSKKPVVSAQS